MRDSVILAILRRELLTQARGRWLRWQRVGFVAALSACLLISVMVLVDQGPAPGMGGLCFRPLAWFLFIAVISLGPQAGLQTMAQEWRERTIGLLLLTPEGPMPVVLGKVLTPFLSSSMYLLAGLPAMLFCLTLGGLSLGQLLGTLGFLEILLLTCVSAGLWAGATVAGANALRGGGWLVFALFWGVPVWLYAGLQDHLPIALTEFLIQLFPPVFFYELLRGSASPVAGVILALLLLGQIAVTLRWAQARIEKQVRQPPAVPVRQPAAALFLSAAPWLCGRCALRPGKAAVVKGQALANAPRPKWRLFDQLFGRPNLVLDQQPLADVECWRYGHIMNPYQVLTWPLLMALFWGGTGVAKNWPNISEVLLVVVPSTVLQLCLWGSSLWLIGGWISLNSQAFRRDTQFGALELLFLTDMDDSELWRQKQSGYIRVFRLLGKFWLTCVVLNLLWFGARGDLADMPWQFFFICPLWLGLAAIYAWALARVGLLNSLRLGRRRQLNLHDAVIFGYLVGSSTVIIVLLVNLPDLGHENAIGWALFPLLLTLPPWGLGRYFGRRLDHDLRRLALAAQANAGRSE
jgi:hypothetical protein